METADPNASPSANAVESVEPHGWDHGHCAFCWAKFMTAAYPPEQREWRQQNPEILTAGYTVTGPDGSREWVCPACARDFRERFRWTLDPPHMIE